MPKITELKIAQLSAAFANELLEDIGKENMALVRERNAAESNSLVCHSHDFCDANMVMERVLLDAGFKTFNRAGEMPDRIVALWNAVWERSMREHLTA